MLQRALEMSHGDTVLTFFAKLCPDDSLLDAMSLPPFSHIMIGVVPEHLGVLNLSFNKIKAMPKALGNAPVLQQMYLANNQLTDLPSSYAKLPMVDLFLSENLFTTVPKAVFGMVQVNDAAG
jgi:Leucine-rich repeat (LRR) protein